MFHRCLADEAININERFSIDACPSAGQIINITSAVVGFGPVMDTNDSLPQCQSTGGATCTRKTNHPSVMSCNGQRRCSFSQDVLRFSSPDKLCDRHQNANFIMITYDCISGERISCLCVCLFLPTSLVVQGRQSVGCVCVCVTRCGQNF